jgi:hypothetical protein
MIYEGAVLQLWLTTTSFVLGGANDLWGSFVLGGANDLWGSFVKE